tara:strand:- start:6324 stop:6545 length:222 start_codon:yes stop_codon:yes gene_type:complete
MIFKLGKYFIFYRHFLYGSASLIGTIISIELTEYNLVSLLMLIISGLLISSSLIVSYTINKYPHDFTEELKDL